MSAKAEYMKSKKQLMELLEGKNHKAIEFVVSQFEGLAKAEKENIVRAGLVDAILGQIKQIPNKNMSTLYFLVEQFRKNEVLAVTDAAYNELQTDLRKRLVFEVQSFFWANKVSFLVNTEDSVFEFRSADNEFYWLSLLVSVNTDSGYLARVIKPIISAGRTPGTSRYN